MGLLSQALLILGVAVVVMFSIAAAFVREPLSRLHLLAPVTSLGAPVIGVAVALDSGVSLSAVLVIATTAAIAVTGPVVQVAIGHAIARARAADTGFGARAECVVRTGYPATTSANPYTRDEVDVSHEDGRIVPVLKARLHAARGGVGAVRSRRTRTGRHRRRSGPARCR